MALEALKCPNCNGDVDLDKNQEYGFCKYCGTKVQNTNFKVVKGKIKIDNDEKIEKLYILARRAKSEDDSETAFKYYEEILKERPEDWEATFYTAYFDCMNIRFKEMASACRKLARKIPTVFELLDKQCNKTIKNTQIMFLLTDLLKFQIFIESNANSYLTSDLDKYDKDVFYYDYTDGLGDLFFNVGKCLEKYNYNDKNKRFFCLYFPVYFCSRLIFNFFLQSFKVTVKNF